VAHSQKANVAIRNQFAPKEVRSTGSRDSKVRKRPSQTIPTTLRKTCDDKKVGIQREWQQRSLRKWKRRK